MTAWLKLSFVVYWLALVMWVGSLMAVGVTAVTTFTILPDAELGLTLERFDAFNHDEHGRIAAGLVNEPAFTFTDVVQVAAACVVLLMLILQVALFGQRWRRAANLIRSGCILIAAALLVIRMMMITPDMNRELRAYWSAAEAGNHDTAMAHREAFDRHHKIARPMFDATLLLLLVGVAASATATIGRDESADERNTSSLEQPTLSRR